MWDTLVSSVYAYTEWLCFEPKVTVSCSQQKHWLSLYMQRSPWLPLCQLPYLLFQSSSAAVIVVSILFSLFTYNDTWLLMPGATPDCLSWYIRDCSPINWELSGHQNNHYDGHLVVITSNLNLTSWVAIWQSFLRLQGTWLQKQKQILNFSSY